uniref:Uncharacterized protein n=1 Tax=Sphenodon punctatus TaxID=8508 RepID=A0A8D0LBL9_SPHPU
MNVRPLVSPPAPVSQIVSPRGRDRVCKRMDLVCQRMLNQGFLKVERYHNLCQKQVKAQLPRRESERRNHSLARHADILAAVETRLSLLNMTFMKYVDSNLCCFIPGKVNPCFCCNSVRVCANSC